MIISGVGVQAGASAIVGSDTLPSSPTFRQIYTTPAGLYICLSDGSWSLLDSADAGTVSGSGVTNRLTKWIDGTGSVLGDSGVADDGTNILALRPFAVGFGLSTPAQLLAGPKITAASIISTSPRGVISAQFSTDTAAAVVGAQKARGTVGTPTTIVTGDKLGSVLFRGYDGTGYLDMGSIDCVSTGTIATNRVPTTLVFSTATDAGPSVLTTALTLGANQSATFVGSVGIGQAPLYKLDVLGPSSSQVHIGDTADNGMYFMALTGTSYILSGASFNGVNWVAKHTSSAQMQMNTGIFTFYGDTGLTPGNNFTPTLRMTLTAAGALNATSDFSVATNKFNVTASSGNYTTAGKNTSYNGIATEGMGHPAIYKTPAITGTQTSAQTIASYTPPAAVGVYRVWGVFTTTSGTNTGTVGFTLDYVDSQGTTHTADIIPVVGAAGAFATTGTAASKEFHTAPYMITINNAQTAIVLKTVVTGSVNYTATGSIEQIR